MKQSINQRPLSRRAVLRGLGAAVALPAMESLATGAPATPSGRLLFSQRHAYGQLPADQRRR